MGAETGAFKKVEIFRTRKTSRCHAQPGVVGTAYPTNPIENCPKRSPFAAI
jgi:hypothetical protein